MKETQQWISINSQYGIAIILCISSVPSLSLYKRAVHYTSVLLIQLTSKWFWEIDPNYCWDADSNFFDNWSIKFFSFASKVNYEVNWDSVFSLVCFWVVLYHLILVMHHLHSQDYALFWVYCVLEIIVTDCTHSKSTIFWLMYVPTPLECSILERTL